jgi:hypothetical protein
MVSIMVRARKIRFDNGFNNVYFWFRHVIFRDSYMFHLSRMIFDRNELLEVSQYSVNFLVVLLCAVLKSFTINCLVSKRQTLPKNWVYPKPV